MPPSRNEPAGATEPKGDGSRPRLLDLSLPIPEDSGERVRALSYLNDTVNHYINEFCDPQDGDGRRLSGTLAAHAAAARKANHDGVSLPHAVQVFLCFSICLFI